MKREFLQSLRVAEQPLSKEVIDAIMEQNGLDIQAAKQAGSAWEEKYNQAVQQHSRQLQQLKLESQLSQAVAKAGGRSVKAISAMLDMEAITKSDDVPAALEAALGELKKESDWLFAAPTPPPYARFTGTGGQTENAPTTLAGALKERMTKR